MDVGEYIWKFIELCQSSYDLQEYPLRTPLKWQSLCMKKYTENKKQIEHGKWKNDLLNWRKHLKMIW